MALAQHTRCQDARLSGPVIGDRCSVFSTRRLGLTRTRFVTELLYETYTRATFVSSGRSSPGWSLRGVRAFCFAGVGLVPSQRMR